MKKKIATTTKKNLLYREWQIVKFSLCKWKSNFYEVAYWHLK